MTTPHLIEDLKADEGLRLTAYPDPLTHAEPWTIGYGHTGPDVHEGLTITPVRAEQLLTLDVTKTCAWLNAKLPWWETLDPLRQDVLANMAFNLGVAKLCAFETFLGLVKAGRYLAASVDMAGTAWAHQVGARAVRLATQMRTGVHP